MGLDALCSLRDKVRERSTGGTIGKHKGQYIAIDHSDPRFREQDQKFLEQLERLIEVVGRRGRVASGINLSAMEIVQRKQLVALFGHETAEAIAVAADGNRVLWTDDLVVALVAEGGHHARRVWTHLVAQFASTRGRFTIEQFVDLSVRLATAGYALTPISAEMVVEAARRSHWDPDQAPLRNVLRELVRPEVTATSLAGVLGRATPLLWRAQVLEGQAVRVFRAILDLVARRPHAYPLLAGLEKNLERLFGVDVFGAAAAQHALQVWFSSRQHILVP